MTTQILRPMTLATRPVESFDELRGIASRSAPRRVAVVGGENPVALAAAAEACNERLARLVLVGDPLRARARLASRPSGPDFGAADERPTNDPYGLAARLAAQGEVDAILDSNRHAGPLFDALRREGIGGFPSGVMVYEDVLAGARRLVAITDVGVNVVPNVECRIAIVRNAIAVMKRLGVARPRVALLAGTDTVSGRVPAPLHDRRLAESAAAGCFADADVFGPVSLDAALAYNGPRADLGRADVLVAPTLEAGNLLARAVRCFGRFPSAHIIAGTAVPIVAPGPADGVDEVAAALALALAL